ncbi:MAG TPA: hypothetical protein VG817_02525 [Gemmatimonadales bacterium]|nr:hypothetical protein [Gemmatimonadales bacterium]
MRLRPLLLLAMAPGVLHAQSAPPPLSFLGIAAGAPLDSIAGRVSALGGKSLRCQRSKAAREVQECRGTLFVPESGRPLAIWLSAIDSSAGIMTLSGAVSGIELDSLRSQLQRSYGVVDASVQGAQWMMQWVRQGRMLRFTWRMEKGEKILSVSLVDGRVLDDWGRRQELRPRPVKPGKSRPAPADTTAPALVEPASPG